MKFSYLPPYGHACCPHCKTEFNLAAANPTVLEKAPHNDIAVYMMCPGCHGAYQAADRATSTSMANECFVNVKLACRSPDGGIFPWAFTTRLTLELNDFDPVAAVENGHGLTRGQYFGICAGTHELVDFPGGVRFVIHKPNTPETV
jgi:hypothetical protein